MKPFAHCRFVFTAILVLCLSAASLPLTSDEPENNEPEKNEQCIIILHGVGRTSVSMKAVEWRLEDEGYVVANNSYPWLGKSIEEIAPPIIEEGLADCLEAGKHKIGFVTHSMGGIILRQYLQDHSIPGMWRVVMLAPPNQGSMMADSLMANEMIEPLLPEPVKQLGTGEASVPKMLGPVNFELGIIAGSNTRFLASSDLDDVANDGTVAVEETRVEGMQDLIVMPVDHTFLMWHSEVLDQVVLFLRDGKFDQVQADAVLADD